MKVYEALQLLDGQHEKLLAVYDNAEAAIEHITAEATKKAQELDACIKIDPCDNTVKIRKGRKNEDHSSHL